MALSIKSAEAEQKVRALAALTGESITLAVLSAVEEKLGRERRKRQNRQLLLEEIRAISHRCAALPTLDKRSEDEILGYDENGIPA
ncbi:type II toxin-antitoxin system VapB family antitoxin [Telmatobacter bradus]|uniref:type II toxin-antitoxin system VapB family antitoxin n=1 Tax=Telmatobacter bradus TaxID=474953 RepID=UPI003B434A03